jgi:Lrp/AsnC family transcriptional regulator, leucine-responsive regulatory protein
MIERIHMLDDAHAMLGYTITVDSKAFGLCVTAQHRMRAEPREVNSLAEMLIETPEVVEANRVTGEDCFLTQVVVRDVKELEIVTNRFQPDTSGDIAIILVSTVERRLPALWNS